MGAAAIIGGVATVASGIGGSLISSGAQTAAANKAADTQMAMYQQTRADLAPFMAGGSQAFSNLANIFGFAPQSTGTTATTGAAGGAASQLSGALSTSSDPFMRLAGGMLQASGATASGSSGTSGTPSTFPAATNNATTTPGVTVPGIAGSSPLSMVVQNGQLAPAQGSTSPLAATGTGVTTGPTSGPNASAAWQALTQFPGYQFGLDQGIQALDRSAASRGLLLSGAQLKDAQKFGADYAAQQAWQPYVSELNWASGLGENAAAGAGNAGTAAAAGAAQSQLAAGQSQAAGITGVANTISQLASSYGNLGGISPTIGGQTGAQFAANMSIPDVNVPNFGL